MRIAARSREEILAEARQQYREAVSKAPPPDYRNIEAVESLDAVLRFTFRGREYQAQPTPYADGVALIAWQARIKALDGRSDAEALAEYADLLTQAAERLHRLARPVRRLARLPYRWRNPFAQATEAEVAYLVGFFAACQTIVRVRHASRN